MKVYIDFNDDEKLQLVTTLTNTQAEIIKDSIGVDNFEEDIKRRVGWVVEEKLKQCNKRLIDVWSEKLKERYDALPTNGDKLAELIFEQPDYSQTKLAE